MASQGEKENNFHLMIENRVLPVVRLWASLLAREKAALNEDETGASVDYSIKKDVLRLAKLIKGSLES